MIVGLTGGIGSGKSAAGKYFELNDITVIDADQLAKEALDIGSQGYDQAIEYFTSSILNDADHIDRSKLRAEIFDDTDKKLQLESIVHPIVRDLMFSKISASMSPYSIVMVPLIFESQSMSSYDRILVVDCKESLQLERACARDGSSTDLIGKIINSQCKRDERLSIANDILPNNETLDILELKVAKLHKFYLKICAND
jgi:dephospho-CoA kinase